MKTHWHLLALAPALLLAVSLVAEEGQKEKRKSGRLTPTSQAMLRMNTLRQAVEALDLTEEQKDKLSKIREELGPKMKEAFGKVLEILTEEQRTTGEESMRKNRDAGLEGRAFFEAVEASLKLTDEQKEKMAKIDQEVLRSVVNEMTQKTLGVLTAEQQEKVKAKLSPAGKKGGKAGKKPG